MKYLDVNYYVEVKAKRYKPLPTENVILKSVILQNFLELTIKLKINLRLGKLKKLLQQNLFN